MIVMMLRDDYTLAEDCCIEIVKSSSISALSEEVTSALDEHVAKTLKIDEFFNFHCLHEELEQSIFLTHDK